MRSAERRRTRIQETWKKHALTNQGCGAHAGFEDISFDRFAAGPVTAAASRVQRNINDRACPRKPLSSVRCPENHRGAARRPIPRHSDAPAAAMPVTPHGGRCAMLRCFFTCFYKPDTDGSLFISKIAAGIMKMLIPSKF